MATNNQFQWTPLYVAVSSKNGRAYAVGPAIFQVNGIMFRATLTAWPMIPLEPESLAKKLGTYVREE